MRQPIFGAGFTSKSLNVTAQSRVNFYADLQPIEDAARVVFCGTPGLDAFVDFGDTPVRGGIEVGDLLYVVHRGVFWEVNNAGTKTNRGSLNTVSGRVDMRYNGTQIAIVDGTNLYIYTVATTTLAAVTTNVITSPKTIAWQDGYFIIENGSQFQVSALDDGTTWDALDVASAESSPDQIVRVYETKSQLIIFGKNSTEFWSNVGALDFPYQRIQGATSDWGLAAQWSVQTLENTVVALMRDVNGQTSVRLFASYAPQAISTPDVEQVINSLTVRSDAAGISYRHSGHQFYQINFDSGMKSYLFDFTSGFWSILESSGSRHRGEIGLGLVSRVLLTDYSDGNIYELNPDTYTENGTEMPCELVSKHIISANEAEFSIGCLWVDMETGVGLTSGQGSDPQAMLRISKDRGHSWGNELWRSIGKIGKYKTRVRWNRLGRGRSFTFKLRISDPVKRAIIGEGWLS